MMLLLTVTGNMFTSASVSLETGESTVASVLATSNVVADYLSWRSDVVQKCEFLASYEWATSASGDCKLGTLGTLCRGCSIP